MKYSLNIFLPSWAAGPYTHTTILVCFYFLSASERSTIFLFFPQLLVIAARYQLRRHCPFRFLSRVCTVGQSWTKKSIRAHPQQASKSTLCTFYILYTSTLLIWDIYILSLLGLQYTGVFSFYLFLPSWRRKEKRVLSLCRWTWRSAEEKVIRHGALVNCGRVIPLIALPSSRRLRAEHTARQKKRYK